MRWYKTLARTLLMLSVINFALTAPVAVRKHEVRASVASAAKDGTATSPLRRDPSDNWQVNMADRANAPPILRSPDSRGHWREQEPTQHNPRSLIDSNGLPEPSNPAPSIDLNADPTEDQSPSPSLSPGSTPRSPTSHARTDEPDLSNPGSSSPHGNPDLNPSLYQGVEPTDDSHALNPASPSGSRPKPMPFLDLNSSPEDQTDQSPRPPLGPAHGDTDLNPSLYQGLEPTDESHALNPASPSGSRPKPMPLLDLNSPPESPSPPLGPAPTSPSATSQAPADEPDPLNSGPSSPHDDSHTNLASPLRSPDPASDNDIDVNFRPQSSSQKFKTLSELMSTTSPLTPSPDDSPQTSSSPDESHSSGSSASTDSGSTSSGSPQRHVSPPASSSDPSTEEYFPSSPDRSLTKEPYLSSGSTDSGSTSSGSPQRHVSPPASSSDPSTEEYYPSSPDRSSTKEPYLSSQDQSSTEEYHSSSLDQSSAEKSHPSSSDQPSTKENHPSSSDQPSTEENHPSSPDRSSTEESYLSSPDHSPTEEYYLKEPDQLSTGESHPLTLEPTDNPPLPASPSNPGPSTDNPPLPASPSNPGPSTEPNPPPSAKRPRPEKDELGSSLTKILKGEFKPRFSGSGALNAA